jgi:hypothetical protein
MALFFLLRQQGLQTELQKEAIIAVEVVEAAEVRVVAEVAKENLASV